MTNKTSSSKLQIIQPIAEQDFVDVLKLTSENIVTDINYGIEHIKKLSLGEVLLVKVDNKIVGAIVHCRPNKTFIRNDENHFDLENIKSNKDKIGYIEVVVVDSDFQRMGIGKILIEEALKLQKSWKTKAVSVHCWQGSPGNGSEKLFTKLGFTKLKMHKSPWLKHSKKLKGKYSCVLCGNPCKCDELEMVKYL